MLDYGQKHVLLIVDIQRKYEQYFNLTYLQKVNKYLKKHSFDEVRMLIDTFYDNMHGDYIPAFLNNNLTHVPIFKQYSSQLAVNLLRQKGIDEPEIKKELFLYKRYCPFNDGLLFLLEPNYIPNYAACHGDELDYYHLEFIPSSFKEFLLSCQSKQIHLIGGGYSKCVAITQKILNLLHINNLVHARVCYEIDNFSSLSYCSLRYEIEQDPNKHLEEIFNHRTKEVHWIFKENATFQVK